jgi:uncharacterized protein (DUF305 family)
MSSIKPRATLLLVALLFVGVGVSLAASYRTDSTEKQFLDANKTAMDTMMSAMNVQPLGDVDQDFTATMIPHHQGAIDMAPAELRYGHNELLRRIAQEIVVEQQQEIVAMRLATRPNRSPGDSPATIATH